MSESTSISRRLVLTFTETVDLYEHIAAGYFDYGALRQALASTGVLADIQALLSRLATRPRLPGQRHPGQPRPRQPAADRQPELARLQARIAALPPDVGPSTLVLKKILLNLRDVSRRVGSIRRLDEAQAAALPRPRPHGQPRAVRGPPRSTVAGLRPKPDAGLVGVSGTPCAWPWPAPWPSRWPSCCGTARTTTGC
ncbi:MAG: FUSC family membrane protein [Hymenobacter sp.]